MTTPTKWGSTRELWLLDPTDDGITPKSFLLDDTVSHESSAPPSRSITLGDAIDTGPYSTWSQTSWIGGLGVREWDQDRQVYWYGTADTTEPSGRIRQWQGLRSIYDVTANATDVRIRKTISGGYHGGSPDMKYTFIALSDGTVVRMSGYGATAAVVAGYGSDITAVGRWAEDNHAQTGEMIAFGTAAGNLWVYDAKANTNFADVVYPTVAHTYGAGAIRGICGMNRIAYVLCERGGTASPALFKRTIAAGPTVVWTLVADATAINSARDMVVWNGKLWLMGVTSGGDTIVYSSDGSTLVEAFTLEDFDGRYLQVHYGSLYVGGDRILAGNDAAPGPLRHTFIYKYNGASITTLWDGTRYPDTVRGTPLSGGMASWGKFLVWTTDYAQLYDADDPPNGSPRWTVNPGVMLYDAENDAISVGPSITPDTSSTGKTPANTSHFTTAVSVVNDRLLLSFYDPIDYTAISGPKYPISTAILRTDGYALHKGFAGYGAFSLGKNLAADLHHYVQTPTYDAGLYHETKSWLTLTARIRIASTDGEVTFSAYFDDSDVAAWYRTASYSYLDAGWRTVRFPIEMQGSRVRLKIDLRDMNSTDDNGHRIEVDSVAVQFMDVPKPRRQWRYRINLSDDQGTLRNDVLYSVNPYATTEALLGKLYDYWANGRVIQMWGPFADGKYPAGVYADPDYKRVIIKDYNANTYRDASNELKVDGGVSITVVEVV